VRDQRASGRHTPKVKLGKWNKNEKPNSRGGLPSRGMGGHCR